MSTVLDRVRKLLALATSPNVHEAAAAAARAQRLIAVHRLEAWLQAADVDPIVDARDTPLEVARRLRPWKIVLASALAGANGCVAYTVARNDGEAIVLIGRTRDREAVGELWDWLMKRIEWLSATHGQNKPRWWHEAFRVGAVDAVVERLQAATEDARLGHGEGLVQIDTAAQRHREELDRFVAERLRLGKGRGIRVDAHAWERGRAAADALELPRDRG